MFIFLESLNPKELGVLMPSYNFPQKYYKYHEMLAEKEKQRIERAGFNTARPPYWKIFKQAFPQLFNVFLIFFVTLSVFPAVYSDIKQHDDDFLIPNDKFTIVTCYLTFNICAMLGSLVTSWVKWVCIVFFPIEEYFIEQ